MKNLVKVCTTVIEAASSLILLVLTFMVFINVVLRYAFNSGITVTEELGRYLFVWVVFAGAVLAAGANSHVRVDLFIRKLKPLPRALVDTLCDAIMIYCCYLIVVGGWAQTWLNMNNRLAVSNLPVGWLYLSGMLAGFCIGLILIVRVIARFASLNAEAKG